MKYQSKIQQNIIRSHIIMTYQQMLVRKNFFPIWLCILIITCYSAQIQVGRHDVTMLQKRKVYCSMMSYHFLDYDMETFQAFTKGFTALRSEAFRSKVATKLAQNCQQKITNEQLMELSKVVQHPEKREQQIQSLQHKYIEYFTPNEKTILAVLEQVKNQTEQQIQNQVDKYHGARKSIQDFAKQLASGFNALAQHINDTTHHTVSSVNKFMESLLHLHGNFSTGWTRFHQGLMKSVQEIKGNFTETVDDFNAHPHVQTLKDWWGGIWQEEL